MLYLYSSIFFNLYSFFILSAYSSAIFWAAGIPVTSRSNFGLSHPWVTESSFSICFKQFLYSTNDLDKLSPMKR